MLSSVNLRDKALPSRTQKKQDTDAMHPILYQVALRHLPNPDLMRHCPKKGERKKRMLRRKTPMENRKPQLAEKCSTFFPPTTIITNKKTEDKKHTYTHVYSHFGSLTMMSSGTRSVPATRSPICILALQTKPNLE